jgi:hypothetical protein
MRNFQLNAGVLGWHEQTFSSSGSLTAQTINASNGVTTSTLTNLLSSVLFGSSGGYVAYEQGGQLYDWSPAGGSVLLFNATPGQGAPHRLDDLLHERRLAGAVCGTDAQPVLGSATVPSETIALTMCSSPPPLTL